MRILSITAQKPDCTGSGIFLSELIKGFAEMGVEQAVVAGIYKDDVVILPDEVAFKPVYFNTVELPFAIAGMSDEMPYESTVYSKMTKDMVSRFEQVFVKNVTDVIEKFNPDLILCHHLYLLTALVRNKCVDKKIVGIC
ncbi:MAG: glycosyl transferase family 1, partial [Lachnospiraceae bacterium]|nr:glycosyl transferase family 1 [Lachnospiraceae bacterium]